MAHRSRRRHARATDESQQRRGLSDSHRREHCLVRRDATTAVPDRGCGRSTSSSVARVESASGWSNTRRCRPARMGRGSSPRSPIRAPRSGPFRFSTASRTERDVQPFTRVQRERDDAAVCRGLPLLCVRGRRLAEGSGAIATARPSSSGAPETIRCRRRLDSHVMPGASPSRCDAMASSDCTCCLPMAPSSQPLTDAVDVRGSSSWSPDQKWIVTGGADASGDGLFKVPVDGGPAGSARQGTGARSGVVSRRQHDRVRRAERRFTVAAARRQARRIACRAARHPVPARRRREPKPDSCPTAAGSSTCRAWSSRRISGSSIWRPDRSRQLTRFDHSAAMWGFDVSPDGKQIVFDRSRNASDIVLIDLPRNPPR